MPPKPPAVQDSASPDGTAVAALAQLPPSLAVIKMENDSFQQMAIIHPRNVGAITQELIAQVNEYPAFAR